SLYFRERIRKESNEVKSNSDPTADILSTISSSSSFISSYNTITNLSMLLGDDIMDGELDSKLDIAHIIEIDNAINEQDQVYYEGKKEKKKYKNKKTMNWTGFLESDDII